MFQRKLSLRIKFITGLVVFALTMGGCLGIILYFHLNSIMKTQISQRSRMLLAQSDAVQDYVKTVLRPEMFNTLPEGQFILKAMSSSYISRQVMTRLNIQEDQDYLYRRVAKNARNPESAPNELETFLIREFNKNRNLTIWEDDSFVENIKYHFVARPVIFNESCMNCHGDPADAPVELIKLYGDKKGFHHTVGEIGGVVVAGFPVDMIKEPVRELTSQYIFFYLIGILLFALLISLFFDRVVMKNLHNLSTIFKTRFSGRQEQRIIERLKEKDEIEGLIEGIDELAICLSDARNELEGYTLNLEKEVANRTKEINVRAEKHRADVKLFVEILSKFGDSIDAEDVITGAIKSIGKRFGAEQVIYHCIVASNQSYAWKSEAGVKKSDDQIMQILWENQVVVVGTSLYLPVKSPEVHWGVLSISFKTAPELKKFDHAVLLGLGRQMAILIENTQAFLNLRFQNDKLESVFEGISDPLLLIDMDCHIYMENNGSKNLLSEKIREKRENELKNILSFQTLHGSKNQRKNIFEQIQQKKSPVSREVRTADDKSFRIFIYPLPKREGSDLRLVVYAREITMEKQVLAKMQQTERLSAIGKMAAGVAHEINNPLGVISCYTDLVKDAVKEKETLEDIRVIEKHTKNVKKIVQELLKLSRPKPELSGACRINDIVRDSIKVFKAQSASKDIDLLSFLEPDLPNIMCDGSVLEQILTNLWINAFDALQKTGGSVTIKTGLSKNRKDILLSMTDNGPGIPDHILGHIFDPFFTTKEIGKGTGLGLAVVHGLINELGGRIEVESNQGTTFKIYFPVERRKIEA